MNGVPELLILRLLQQEEMYGYEIVQAIRSRTEDVIAVVSMGFTLAPTAQGTPDSLLHAMMLLSIMALPYLTWRSQQAFWRPA